MGELAGAAKHPASVVAARCAVVVEEFGLALEDEVDGLAEGLDRLLGHRCELSIVLPSNVREAGAKSWILDVGYEVRDGGGLLSPEVGGDQGPLVVENGERTVRLGAILGLEVNVRDLAKQREDPGRRLVATLFSFQAGTLVEVAEGPAVHVPAVAYGRFDVHGSEVLGRDHSRRFLAFSVIRLLLFRCHFRTALSYRRTR